MELWIRRQDRRKLVKVKTIEILDHYANNTREYVYTAININGEQFASYKSKERALEVLDEIQKKLTTSLLLKPKRPLKLDEIEKGKKYFENLNDVNFITCDNNFEIKPIMSNVIVYEMPKE